MSVLFFKELFQLRNQMQATNDELTHLYEQSKEKLSSSVAKEIELKLEELENLRLRSLLLEMLSKKRFA